MVIQHAMYVLKTCIAQAERLPRVLRQLVEDHRMLEVTAGILQSRLEPASHASSEADLPKGKAEKGLVDLAAFCQVGPSVLMHHRHHLVNSFEHRKDSWSICLFAVHGIRGRP